MTECNQNYKLEQFVKEYAKDPEFIAEGLSIKVVEEMLGLLRNKGLNQSWLAEQMEVTRSHISKILNARPNMTLLTIAKIAVALGVTPDIRLDAESKERSHASEAADATLSSIGICSLCEDKASGLVVNAKSDLIQDMFYAATNPAGVVDVSAPRQTTLIAAEEPELVLAA